MVEVRERVHVPVPAEQAFAVAADLERADWLPVLRNITKAGGPARGVGARYEVEVDIVGRRLRRFLVCREWDEPRLAVFSLEGGMTLDIVLRVAPAGEGCDLELGARYSVGSGLAARAVERASAAPARRETAQAVRRLAARLQAS